MKKEKCEKCRIEYPQDLVHTLVTYKGVDLIQINLCGICALEMSNRIHEIKRKRFTGSNAEKARKAAIKWRAALERGEVK